MTKLVITHHAIERYRERVEDVSESEVRARLSASAFKVAAEFGARFVRFARGQRAVVIEGRIVTILPADQRIGCLDPNRDHLHDAGGPNG